MTPPPTDKHVLVLLTAFEMFDTNLWDDEGELFDLVGPSNHSYDDFLVMVELEETEWISHDAYESRFYISPEQAQVINRHYPSALA